jgi:branched-chain amino acid transport system permease protein
MLAFLSPFGFMSPYAQGVFVSGGIFAIATIGLYVTITSGQVSVMHQALVGVGGYAAGVASVQLGLPLVGSLLFGLVAGALVGGVVALLLREMNGMVLGVATIAIGQALSLIAANIPQLGGSLGYTGISLQTTLTWVVGILIIVMAGLSWLRHTHFGLALLAVGKEPAVAEALGMSATFVRVWAFGVGGALAGIAGGLQAHWLSLQEPTALGFAYEALLFMYLIIGGVGSPWGALVGAVGSPGSSKRCGLPVRPVIGYWASFSWLSSFSGPKVSLREEVSRPRGRIQLVLGLCTPIVGLLRAA